MQVRSIKLRPKNHTAPRSQEMRRERVEGRILLRFHRLSAHRFKTWRLR